MVKNIIANIVSSGLEDTDYSFSKAEETISNLAKWYKMSIRTGKKIVDLLLKNKTSVDPKFIKSYGFFKSGNTFWVSIEYDDDNSSYTLINNGKEFRKNLLDSLDGLADFIDTDAKIIFKVSGTSKFNVLIRIKYKHY